jgi:hypothetical protein
MRDNIKKTLWATADKLHANMDAVEVVTLLNEQQATHLTTLRDTILPRVISGQLRLPVLEEEEGLARPQAHVRRHPTESA